MSLTSCRRSNVRRLKRRARTSPRWETVVYPTFEQEVERIWIIEMVQLGHSADDARKILRSRMIQTNVTAPHLTAPNEKRERLRNRRRSENFTLISTG